MGPKDIPLIKYLLFLSVEGTWFLKLSKGPFSSDFLVKTQLYQEQLENLFWYEEHLIST